jgi:hypothetical protein
MRLLHSQFLPLAVWLLWVEAAPGLPAGSALDLDALSDDAIARLTLRFERTRCYGDCPAYTVVLHGDGRVEYNGLEHVKVVGSASGHVEPTAIRELVAMLQRVKFTSMGEQQYTAEQCACRRCTDMSTAITEVSVGDGTHRVEHYYGCGCAPESLFDLEAAIDKAVGVEKWTGDVSEQGPFGTTCFG